MKRASKATGRNAMVTIDGVTYAVDEYELNCQVDTTLIEEFGNPAKIAVHGSPTLSFSGTLDEADFAKYLSDQMSPPLRDPLWDDIDRVQEREYYRQRKEEIVSKFTKADPK